VTAEAPVLKVRGLTAGYGGRAVARLDSLALAPGRAALLLGPSGSGKTTLLLAIAGLADVMAGEVEVAGEHPARLSPHARDRFRGRNLALVFQDLQLVAGLGALDNVLLAPFAAGVRQDRARAAELLDRLGLGADLHRRAERLSRGQAQRVAIARALILKPKVILADEPTASLDDAACASAYQLLSDAAAEAGAALLIATHDSRLRAVVDTAVAVEPAA
jgi:putative ABC transport system ATP-binding protein